MARRGCQLSVVSVGRSSCPPLPRAALGGRGGRWLGVGRSALYWWREALQVALGNEIDRAGPGLRPDDHIRKQSALAPPADRSSLDAIALSDLGGRQKLHSPSLWVLTDRMGVGGGAVA